MKIKVNILLTQHSFFLFSSFVWVDAPLSRPDKDNPQRTTTAIVFL